MLFAMSLMGCETPISVSLPDTQPMLVLEGRIEPGLPPVVLLSHSQDYFAPVDAGLLGSLYQGGGSVVLSIDGEEYPLDEICAGDLGPDELIVASVLLGVPLETLILSNLCAYTSLSIQGEVGRTYGIRASLEGDTVRSMSRLNPPVALDLSLIHI